MESSPRQALDAAPTPLPHRMPKARENLLLVLCSNHLWTASGNSPSRSITHEAVGVGVLTPTRVTHGQGSREGLDTGSILLPVQGTCVCAGILISPGGILAERGLGTQCRERTEFVCLRERILGALHLVPRGIHFRSLSVDRLALLALL